MNLIAVQCRRSTDEKDDEPRIGVVIADGRAETEQLCKAMYAGEGFNRFEATTVVEGMFGGPARVLGYTGQKGAFGWK
jgi:hypothetical protein